MMLDIDFSELRAGFARYLPFGIAIALVLLAEIIIAGQAWEAGGLQMTGVTAPTPDAVPNIQAIGDLLYSRYLYVFEGAGLVLLVAMIGAIVLTHRARGGVRQQNVGKQNRRRPQDATRMANPPVGQGVEL
jgi:NADH-quinone oxidoreductase subunit J